MSELTIRAMTPADWPAVQTIYGEVIGWVAAQRISARQVYAEVLETSIYVAGRAHASASAGRPSGPHLV